MTNAGITIDRDAVNRAVQQAESQTSAEIVPVVATSSGRYDRPEDLAGLWGALLAMTAAWFVWRPVQPSVGDWAAPHPLWSLAALWVAVLVGFVVGTILCARISLLRRLFTSRRQMREEVQRRARQVFFDSRVHHTRESSGVLLYVSLFERMAVVLGDARVTGQLGQQELEELCADFTARLRAGDLTSSLCGLIEEAGRRLAARLPRQEGDVNELPDAVQLLDRP